MTLKHISWAGVTAALIASGYAYILFWFGQVDFYHRHFFDHGALVSHYQLLRLLFIPCFAWTVYAVGAGAAMLVSSRDGFKSLPLWERYPLGFIIGAGLWQVGLFILGLNGLYLKPIAVTLSFGVMLLSIPHLSFCLREAYGAITTAPRKNVPWIAAIAIAVAAFLLTKGLYPGGGHDYYNHYFPYLRRVVETGSLAPNDVWYHYFYSKGLGLYFLAILLTDPLAPQLAVTGFIFCGACTVFALLRRAAPQSQLPWLGVLLYVSFYIYTYGDLTAWGELEKNHEPAAALMLGMLWVSWRLFFQDAVPKCVWALALHAAIVAMALITLPLALMAGIYMAGFALWFAYKRQWHTVLLPLGAGATAAVMLLAILAINYHDTGLFLDQGMVYFWRYADIRKLANWGVMFEMLQLHQQHTLMAEDTASWSWTLVSQVAAFLKVGLWWPLMILPLAIITCRLPYVEARRFMAARVDPALWGALLWFVGVLTIAALFGGGRIQIQSFYRMASFSYAPTLCFSLLMLRLASGNDPWWSVRVRRMVHGLSALVVLQVAALVVIYIAISQKLDDSLLRMAGNAAALTEGEFSLKEAYQNQQGWPDRLAYGGIYPGLEEPYKIAGPGTRIWSFHVYSYCMLPDCNLQGLQSFRLSPRWPVVFLGSPENAREGLQQESLNYFFFTKDMNMEDFLPETPLFSPKTIGKYLAIRWTDGTSYLLTWPGPHTRPIDRAFLEAYTHIVNTRAPRFKEFPKDTWRKMAAYLAAHPNDAKPFCLPWSKDCDGLVKLKY